MSELTDRILFRNASNEDYDMIFSVIEGAIIDQMINTLQSDMEDVTVHSIHESLLEFIGESSQLVAHIDEKRIINYLLKRTVMNPRRDENGDVRWSSGGSLPLGVDVHEWCEKERKRLIDEAFPLLAENNEAKYMDFVEDQLQRLWMPDEGDAK